MSRIYLDGEVWFCSEHPDPDACDCPRPPPVREGTPRMLLRCACKEIGHTGGCLACSDDPRPLPAALWENAPPWVRKHWAHLRGDRGDLGGANPCGTVKNLRVTGGALENLEVGTEQIRGVVRAGPDGGSPRVTFELKPWTGQGFDQRQLPEPFKCARCGQSFCMCAPDPGPPTPSATPKSCPKCGATWGEGYSVKCCFACGWSRL